MGNTVSKQAARDRIMEDIATTITQADARVATGPSWGAAKTRLGPVQKVYLTIAAKRAVAATEAAPLIAAVGAKNAAADDLIKGICDLIWNEIGRPQSDALFEVLFPEGAAIYTDGPVDDQPDLMLLLAELLESNIHPALTLESSTAKAASIRFVADDLGSAVTAASVPSARVNLFDRVLTAVAKASQVELAKLKRYWKSEGISEADIHTVIPDRPRSYGVAKPSEPTVPTPPNPPVS